MILYKGWTIERKPKPIPDHSHDWEGYLDEGICITGPSVQALMHQIDIRNSELFDEVAEVITDADYKKNVDACKAYAAEQIETHRSSHYE